PRTGFPAQLFHPMTESKRPAAREARASEQSVGRCQLETQQTETLEVPAEPRLAPPRPAQPEHPTTPPPPDHPIAPSPARRRPALSDRAQIRRSSPMSTGLLLRSAEDQYQDQRS